MTPPLLITIFGRAKVDTSGYYRITSRKEGNHHKLLHRLIFEKFHGSIPEGYIIHHVDGDKFNNCILNLELLSFREHMIHHDKGNDTKLVKLIKDGEIEQDMRPSLIKYIQKHCPEELD